MKPKTKKENSLPSSETPEKKKRSYKKKNIIEAVPVENSNVSDLPLILSDKDKNEIDDIFNMAVLEHIDQLENKIYKEKHRDMEHLRRLVGEYLESFIIIGYDFTGNECHINLSKTDKDDNALNEILKNVFVRAQIKTQMGNQEMF